MSAPNVEEYLGKVRAIALRLSASVPANVDIEDLTQAGAIGLLDAATKFDPSKGIPFGTYAHYRIHGAMLDHLRDSDWASRLDRQDRNKIGRAIQRTGEHEPGAIASELGITEEAFQRRYNELAYLSAHMADALGEPFEAGSDAEWAHPARLAERSQLRDILGTLRGQLSARSQLLIELYYGPEELNLRAIAERLGVSESRVSQLHAVCIAKLKAALEEIGIASAAEMLS